MRIAAVLLATACLLAPAGRPAAAAPYEATAEALRTELVEAWTELGAWCVTKQLFAARDELATAILAFAPDHERARAWLRYRRGKDGGWTRRSPYKPPPNRKPGHLPEYAARREAILADLRPRVIAAIRDAEPPLSLAAKAAAVAAWRPHLGDDPALLALAGLTLHEGRWRATDTVRSLARRAALKQAAQAALAEVPAVGPRPMPEAARALELPWSPGRGTARVAAYGTAGTGLLDACVRMVHATERLMEAALGGTFETRDYFAVYVMRERAHFETVVDRHPTIQGDRAVLRGLSGAYVGHGQFVDLMSSRGGVLDSSISVTTQHLLSLRFAEGRSTWMPGWVADGFPLYYMTWLTGTHLSFTVDLGRYGQDPLFESLFSSATDWLAEARALMLSNDPATLRLTLGLKVGRMGPRDFLAAYGFVAWLHEARTPVEIDALLRALAAGQDVDAAFAASLGMTVEDAQSRLVRWLRETGGDD